MSCSPGIGADFSNGATSVVDGSLSNALENDRNDVELEDKETAGSIYEENAGIFEEEIKDVENELMGEEVKADIPSPEEDVYQIIDQNWDGFQVLDEFSDLEWSPEEKDGQNSRRSWERDTRSSASESKSQGSEKRESGKTSVDLRDVNKSDRSKGKSDQRDAERSGRDSRNRDRDRNRHRKRDERNKSGVMDQSSQSSRSDKDRSDRKNDRSNDSVKDRLSPRNQRSQSNKDDRSKGSVKDRSSQRYRRSKSRNKDRQDRKDEGTKGCVQDRLGEKNQRSPSRSSKDRPDRKDERRKGSDQDRLGKKNQRSSSRSSKDRSDRKDERCKDNVQERSSRSNQRSPSRSSKDQSYQKDEKHKGSVQERLSRRNQRSPSHSSKDRSRRSERGNTRDAEDKLSIGDEDWKFSSPPVRTKADIRKVTCRSLNHEYQQVVILSDGILDMSAENVSSNNIVKMFNKSRLILDGVHDFVKENVDLNLSSKTLLICSVGIYDLIQLEDHPSCLGNSDCHKALKQISMKSSHKILPKTFVRKLKKTRKQLQQLLGSDSEVCFTTLLPVNLEKLHRKMVEGHKSLHQFGDLPSRDNLMKQNIDFERVISSINLYIISNNPATLSFDNSVYRNHLNVPVIHTGDGDTLNLPPDASLLIVEIILNEISQFLENCGKYEKIVYVGDSRLEHVRKAWPKDLRFNCNILTDSELTLGHLSNKDDPMFKEISKMSHSLIVISLCLKDLLDLQISDECKSHRKFHMYTPIDIKVKQAVKYEMCKMAFYMERIITNLQELNNSCIVFFAPMYDFDLGNHVSYTLRQHRLQNNHSIRHVADLDHTEKVKGILKIKCFYNIIAYHLSSTFPIMIRRTPIPWFSTELIKLNEKSIEICNLYDGIHPSPYVARNLAIKYHKFTNAALNLGFPTKEKYSDSKETLKQTKHIILTTKNRVATSIVQNEVRRPKDFSWDTFDRNFKSPTEKLQESLFNILDPPVSSKKASKSNDTRMDDKSDREMLSSNDIELDDKSYKEMDLSNDTQADEESNEEAMLLSDVSDQEEDFENFIDGKYRSDRKELRTYQHQEKREDSSRHRIKEKTYQYSKRGRISQRSHTDVGRDRYHRSFEKFPHWDKQKSLFPNSSVFQNPRDISPLHVPYRETFRDQKETFRDKRAIFRDQQETFRDRETFLDRRETFRDRQKTSGDRLETSDPLLFRSRSRSMSPPPYARKHPRSVSRTSQERFPTHGASKQERVYFRESKERSSRYLSTREKNPSSYLSRSPSPVDSQEREALKSLREVHERECAMYRNQPIAHSDYEKEYKKYKDKKLQCILDLGGDPNSYDISKDWEKFWHSRLEELLVDSWNDKKKQCLKMIKQSKSSRNILSLHLDRSRQKRLRSRSPSLAKRKSKKQKETKKNRDSSSRSRSKSISNSSSSRSGSSSSSRSSRSNSNNSRSGGSSKSRSRSASPAYSKKPLDKQAKASKSISHTKLSDFHKKRDIENNDVTKNEIEKMFAKIMNDDKKMNESGSEKIGDKQAGTFSKSEFEKKYDRIRSDGVNPIEFGKEVYPETIKDISSKIDVEGMKKLANMDFSLRDLAKKHNLMSSDIGNPREFEKVYPEASKDILPKDVSDKEKFSNQDFNLNDFAKKYDLMKSVLGNPRELEKEISPVTSIDFVPKVNVGEKEKFASMDFSLRELEKKYLMKSGIGNPREFGNPVHPEINRDIISKIDTQEIEKVASFFRTNKSNSPEIKKHTYVMEKTSIHPYQHEPGYKQGSKLFPQDSYSNIRGMEPSTSRYNRAAVERDSAESSGVNFSKSLPISMSREAAKGNIYGRPNVEREYNMVGGPSSKRSINREEATDEVSSTTPSFGVGSQDDLLEILEILTRIGDRLGVLKVPLGVLYDKALQNKSQGFKSTKLLDEKDAKTLLHLISTKLKKMVNESDLSLIQQIVIKESSERLINILNAAGPELDTTLIAQKCLGKSDTDTLSYIQSQFLQTTSSIGTEDQLKTVFDTVKLEKSRLLSQILKQGSIGSSGSAIYDRSSASTSTFDFTAKSTTQSYGVSVSTAKSPYAKESPSVSRFTQNPTLLTREEPTKTHSATKNISNKDVNIYSPSQISSSSEDSQDLWYPKDIYKEPTSLQQSHSLSRPSNNPSSLPSTAMMPSSSSVSSSFTLSDYGLPSQVASAGLEVLSNPNAFSGRSDSDSQYAKASDNTTTSRNKDRIRLVIPKQQPQKFDKYNRH